MKTNKSNPILGKFGKGVAGSVSINFSESAGKNCSDRCKLKNAGCYAETLEKVRPNVKRVGIRKRELGPTQLANKATIELRNVRSPWVRLSVLGSLPMPAQAKKAAGFKEAFKRLLEEAQATGAKLHIPVETKSKADLYQSWADEVDPEIVVRESCQTEAGVLASKSHNSFVVGANGEPKKSKIDKADKLIAKLRKQGKTVVNCPAIISDSKCGKCKACSSSKVDTVVYLKH